MVMPAMTVLTVPTPSPAVARAETTALAVRSAARARARIDGSSTDADYMLSTSTGGIEPAAYNRAVLYDLEGSLSLVGGPLRPVVYVPVVGKGIPNTVTLTGRADAVYGRVVSPIRMESILGDENVDEVWRWSRFTLEEEV